MIYVQFSDDRCQEITSIFSCQQDTNIYQNQGTVEQTDDRYTTFLAKQSVHLE